MNKRLYIALLILLSGVFPQLLSSQVELNLFDQWTDPSIPGTNAYDNPFNEIWGMALNGREVAILGSTLGTHLIDVTDPENVFERFFIPGSDEGPQIIHRDYHDFQGYLYAVSDEGGSSLQIIDMRAYPDTVSVVYDDNEFVRTAHNIFIDSSSALLYLLGTIRPPVDYAPMRVLSLADPEAPVLINSIFNIEGASIGYVHDAFVRNDTAFLNCGGNGMFVADFSDPSSPTLLGSLTSYPQEGYNHSGWMHPSLQLYYLADENHGRDVKVVDVSNLEDMSVIHTFNADSDVPQFSIPHNLIVKGDKLYISYYYDGLQVYDLSANPEAPQRIGFYKTSSETHKNSYEGAWGVYPFLPSGNLLVSDMQQGLFVIQDGGMVVSTTEIPNSEDWLLFPNPARDHVVLTLSEPVQSIQLIDAAGKLCHTWQGNGLPSTTHSLPLQLPEQLPAGVYYLRLILQKEKALPVWRSFFKQ